MPGREPQGDIRLHYLGTENLKTAAMSSLPVRWRQMFVHKPGYVVDVRASLGMAGGLCSMRIFDTACEQITCEQIKGNFGENPSVVEELGAPFSE